MTFADKLFDAQIALLCAEGELSDTHLTAAIGDACDGAWDDYTFDYYDRSIEVYGVGDLSDEARERALDALAALGFAVAWLHPHTGGRTLPGGSRCKCPGVGLKQRGRDSKNVLPA